MSVLSYYVIWSESRMGQYRDDDHREHASHFNRDIEISSDSDVQKRPFKSREIL